MQQLSRTEEVLDQALQQLDEVLRRHVAQQAGGSDPTADEPQQLAELLTQLDGVQTQNDFARQVYNQAASDYNTALRLFPTTVVAGLFSFDPVATMPLGRPRS
jgi:LemA protein